MSWLGDILGGVAGQKANMASALQARINAQLSQLHGVESAEQARYNLNQTMGTISAIQSARGVGMDSPTTQAIQENTQEMSDRNEAIQRLNALGQTANYTSQGNAYASAARMSLVNGLVSANFDFPLGGG
jgi:hypothetical protein